MRCRTLRPRVALLSGALSGYTREVIHGIHDYLSEHAPWSLYPSEHGRGEILPTWLPTWKGDGIIARVENEKIAKTLLKFGLRRWIEFWLGTFAVPSRDHG